MDLHRLPIIYDIPKDVKVINAFHERMGKFQNPYDEFVDICLNNITWAAYHLLMWQGKPLKLAPFQSVILETLWNKTFPILLASRGASKTFMLAVYAAMRAMLTPGSKIVIVASSFRQSKLVFEYVEQLYNYSPIFAAACPDGIQKPADQVFLKVGDSVIRALPLGNGEKIRGIRASHVIIDEYASINPEVFQVVVRGFAAVSSNPIESATRLHLERRAVKEGRLKPSDMSKFQGNQIVYSGTANYQFNHFYKTYLIHKAIIDSKITGTGKEINSKLSLDEESAWGDTYLDYRDYAIIQIPYQGLPEAFMDEKLIAQAKATMPRALFEMEYECKFPTDSDGFFKRSLINQATPGHKVCGGVAFGVEAVGQPGFEYVMGIDPARKTDNFSISILKLYPHNETYKNVYCFSMNKKSWPVAVRKVRELLKKFNIVRIAMDAGGGGSTVEDLLQDEKYLEPGELPIWRVENEDTDRLAGEHILEVIDFVPRWIAEANYGLQGDIEHKKLTFPYRGLDVDNGSKAPLEIEKEEDEIWEEIDSQIKETCMIVVTPTKTGIQHFDMPELPASQQGTLKTYQRKDRYSALLLSSHAARNIYLVNQKIIQPAMGGWVGQVY